MKTGPPIYEDWTPDVRRLNPRRTGPQDPEAPDEDFVRSRTSWDSGLRGIQDFVGFRTSWDLGLGRKMEHVHTSDRNLVLWCSL